MLKAIPMIKTRTMAGRYHGLLNHAADSRAQMPRAEVTTRVYARPFGARTGANQVLAPLLARRRSFDRCFSTFTTYAVNI